MLQIARFDPANLRKYEAFDGHYTTWEDVKFDDPSCVAAFGEFRPGDDLSHPWIFWNDEVWYIIHGEMDVEWSNPPMFNDHHRIHVGPGDVVLVRLGQSIMPRVSSEGAVRFLWVTMPRPRHFGVQAFWGGGNRMEDQASSAT